VGKRELKLRRSVGLDMFRPGISAGYGVRLKKVEKVSCDKQIEGHANQFGCSEINEGMVTSSPYPLSVVVIHM
jgi:hypothetical protein